MMRKQTKSPALFMRRAAVFLAVFAVSAMAPAIALAKADLKLAVKGEKEIVKTVDGKKVTNRIPLGEDVDVGDVIVYTITYTNPGDKDALEPSIIDPVPDGTVYIMGSAEGKNTEISFSIDGGKSFHKPPVMYMKTEPDGTKKKTEATPDMFTDVQWIVKKALKPGESGTVFFKVSVK